MPKEELQELLTKAKELLRSETTSFAFDTWMKNLDIESAKDGNIVLSTQTEFEKKAIESRYHDLITAVFNHITNKQCNVSIVSKEELSNSQSNQVISTNTYNNNSANIQLNIDDIKYENTNLNPNYTFESFVVGNNNRFAQAAALAVAETPRKYV